MINMNSILALNSKNPCGFILSEGVKVEVS